MFKKGEQMVLLGSWKLCSSPLKLAKYFEMEYGVSCSVVNARFAKPLDHNLLSEHCKNHELIVSLEDNVLRGGFGSAILEQLNESHSPAQLVRFGWPDQFIEHGSDVNELRKKHGLGLR